MALVMLMSLLTLTACWSNNGTSSSSMPPVSSTPPTSSLPPTSSVPETSSLPTEPSSGTGSLPPDSSVNPETPLEGSSHSTIDNGSGLNSNTSKTALSTDFSEIGALPQKSYDWGPGGPVDEYNRSQGALSYNNKFGKYDAVFIGANPNDKKIYLTFDEGYEYGLTGSVLDTLKEKNVKACFFITYDFAREAPELVKRMIDEGHTVGNHSYSHKNYSTLTPVQAAEDLMKMHDYIKQNFNYEMTLFRFPSGNFSEQSLAAVQKMGYKSVFWSFAYRDWIVDSQPDPQTSLERLTKAACPGNILLLHAVSKTNNQILGQLIENVRANGYEWSDIKDFDFAACKKK